MCRRFRTHGPYLVRGSHPTRGNYIVYLTTHYFAYNQSESAIDILIVVTATVGIYLFAREIDISIEFG